ncbi:CFI-box-CTERM domain-containing protein [Thauera sp.]|uniref:CFI-box-CTERM domain-containing protein n=1 Tax=Thauera sp. TaxID=1905334 RepID=UPI0039E6DEA3
MCEQLVRFEHLHGQRRSAQQRGDAEHYRFLRETESDPGARGPCFIATLMYGEGSEVMVLRRFRDLVLRAWPIGRGLILAYYRTAPGVCRVLAGRPVLIGAVRLMLRPFVWGANRIAGREGGRRA